MHGSAPDIAGEDKANPLAMVLSAAMMLRYALDEPAAAQRIEDAVNAVLDKGLRTGDLMSEGMTQVGCNAMGEALLKEIERAQEQGASQQGQPAASAVSGRRGAERCEAPWPEVCRPHVSDHGAAAAAAAAEEEARIGGWGSPAVGGDAWGHAAGAGALVGLTSGEGGELRVRHVVVMVGGRCTGGEARWCAPQPPSCDAAPLIFAASSAFGGSASSRPSVGDERSREVRTIAVEPQHAVSSDWRERGAS
mgnify:CR=1 FL=1